MYSGCNSDNHFIVKKLLDFRRKIHTDLWSRKNDIHDTATIKNVGM